MSDPTAQIRATAGDPGTMDAVRQRYEMLCALRDEANKKAEPVRKKLDAANERAQIATRQAAELAAEVLNIRGGAEKWLALKKEIGQLARLLGGR